MKIGSRELPKERLFSLFVIVTTISWSTQWSWSYLMDEIQYLDWMPRIHCLPDAFFSEIRNYLSQGRLYPVKYLMNLIQFAYLPSSPWLFHGLHWGLWALSLSLGYLALCRSFRVERSWVGYLSFLGFGAGVRTLLDSVTLLTIAETWVIVFLSAGLYFLDRPILSRFFFLLTAFSKEPAACIFAGTAAYRFWGGKRDITQGCLGYHYLLESLCRL